jgi:Tol biopolymer transport system component
MPELPSRLTSALSDRYRIEHELGAGGMATVYLAHDVRHDRPVALKVLRPELAAVMGADRFLAEVRTTANLQHPHILPLFDSGTADGFLFYVMPYVRGESLRERLDRDKQLPVAEAVGIAKAVAGALDYAHRQGVIHRDIKPANILLQDGQPVVADFGIALAVSAAGGGRLTETGLSLGTPYYMSPEQATADRDPGPASDVYSLACVLYEMIAGDPPHTGSTAQAVLARILTDRPRPLTELRETVPANVEGAVTRALSKVPADRFESAGSFAAALDDPGFTYMSPSDTGSSRGAAPTAWVVRPAPRRTVAVLGGLLVAASAAAAWGWLRPGPAAPVQRMRLDVAVSSANGPDIAISPDGTRIVYRRGENTTLGVRPVSSLESQEVPGTEGARGPVFSPDGRSIAFNQGNPDSWHTVALSGGSPITVGTRNDPVNAVAAWSDDGFIYYQRDGGPEPGIVRAPSRGGPSERIPAKEVYSAPVAIPGVTDRILAVDDAKGSGYGFLDVDDGEYRPLEGLEGVTYAMVAGGYIFWRTGDGALVAAHLDARRERLSSAPVTLAQAVENQGFTVSRTGTLVYMSASGGGQALVWVDPSGRQERVDSLLEAAAGAVANARISPDGRRLALVVGPSGVSDATGERRIVVYDIAEASWQQLTFEGSQNYAPQWLPDGRIVFISDQGGGVGVWVKPADRSAEETLLFRAKTGRLDGGLDVSPVPGGPMVVGLSGVAEGETSGLYLVDLTPGAEPRAFVTSRFNVWDPKVSPDGRWVAYVSDESGQERVYIRPFPGGGPPVPVSLDVGSAPVWSATAELYYTTGRTLVRARVDVSGGVRVTARNNLPGTAPEQLILSGPVGARYDIDKDGRILAPSRSGVANSAAGPGGNLPVVVLNVFREIEERLGGSGGG